MRHRVLGTAVVVAVALLLGGCGTAGRSDVAGPRARTVASAPSTVRVVASGDIACEPGMPSTPQQCQQAATAALARSLHPDVVLPLGDEQYQNATPADFAGSYAPSWGQLLSVTRPTIGNHEYLTPGAKGYYDYFRGRQPGPPGYYRVHVGRWQLYLLNSNCDKVSCGREASWLDHQMAAHPSKCSLVTMHHPRYSSGGEHGNDAAVVPLWRAALRHRNDLVLSGHEHDYERFKRMDARGRLKPRRGMLEIVSGVGGRNFYPLGKRKRASVYRQASVFGVLQLDLRPGSFSWAFRTIDGRTLDAGTRSCL